MATEYCFTVNGMRRTTTEKKSLLRYLRDDLHLFSVKDGCSEGACGTCTIIVDGVAVKACVLTTDKSVGRNIVTVEGLTEREQDAFVYAFGSKGSVQCGFCIPGMVMAGKALIDQNPDPTEEEIKYALRGNICRCTGYKKIIEGIQRTVRCRTESIPCRCAKESAWIRQISRRYCYGWYGTFICSTQQIPSCKSVKD